MRINHTVSLTITWIILSIRESFPLRTLVNRINHLTSLTTSATGKSWSYLLFAQLVTNDHCERCVAGGSLKTLLIDNYDSYTYNLWQLLTGINNGVSPIVIYNNQYPSWQLANQELPEYDNIVISPGPGNPMNPKDFGLSSDAILLSKKPVLGICLGHQGIGNLFGAKVCRAPVPMHGRLSRIEHDGQDLFEGIPQSISVVRYHSLIVDGDLPSVLVPTAWTTPDHRNDCSRTSNGPGRILMGLKHFQKPIYGVQFHPESISTEYGLKILQNFKKITLDHKKLTPSRPSSVGMQTGNPSVADESMTRTDDLPSQPSNQQTKAMNMIQIKEHRATHIIKHKVHQNFSIENSVEDLLEDLFGIRNSSKSRSPIGSFWLDSTLAPDSSRIPSGSYSYFGNLETEQDYSVEYLGNNELIIRRNWELSSDGDELILETRSQNIFQYLEDLLDSEKVKVESSVQYEGFLDIDNISVTVPQVTLSDALFGYIGYENRIEAAHIMTSTLNSKVLHGKFNLSATQSKRFSSSKYIDELGYPLATLLHPSRYIIWDHDRRQFYIVAMATSSSEESSRVKAEILGCELLKSLKQSICKIENSLSLNLLKSTTPPSWTTQNILLADKSRQEYLNNIQHCLSNISAGESYEICLTLQFKGPFNDNNSTMGSNKLPEEELLPPQSPGKGTIFDAYKRLRGFNGAPYSSFFHYDPLGSPRLSSAAASSSAPQLLSSRKLPWYKMGGFAILCSSPERYLKIDEHGNVESKPIKGTAKRDSSNPEMDKHIAARLKDDEKSQAENLMIVDLVRNDLGRVCSPGSVHVPSLMHIESYASVHQLVSTICGRLSNTSNSVNAIVATFPGGSMTGAPKIRTMDIIDNLEERGRGVYSGAIGYFGMSGLLDLNIVIRTAVISGGNITIASGGAIVAMSDPKEEVDEVFLKARTVSKALSYDIAFKT